MKNKHLKYFYFIVLALLITFTFTDLAISRMLFNKDSTFGLIFEAIGEVLMPLIGAFSAFYLFKTTKDNKLFSVLFMIAYLFNFATSVLLIGTYTNKNVFILIPFAFIVLFGTIGLTYLVPESSEEVVRKVSKIGLILSIAPIIIVSLIKALWGRERYRNMSDPLAQFTYWFIPNKFTTNNEFMSFPSGHSANSSTIIWITLLPLFIDKLKNKEWVLTIISFVWIVMVMISRIMVGAHFATDVLFGSVITLSIFYYLRNYYFRDIFGKPKDNVMEV